MVRKPRETEGYLILFDTEDQFWDRTVKVRGRFFRIRGLKMIDRCDHTASYRDISQQASTFAEGGMSFLMEVAKEEICYELTHASKMPSWSHQPCMIVPQDDWALINRDMRRHEKNAEKWHGAVKRMTNKARRKALRPARKNTTRAKSGRRWVKMRR